MNLKIRQAQLDKVPGMLIIGDREVENETVSVRLRGGAQVNGLPLADVAAAVSRAIAEHLPEIPLA
jgi:threonyl-tRNA synthetase